MYTERRQGHIQTNDSGAVHGYTSDITIFNLLCMSLWIVSHQTSFGNLFKGEQIPTNQA